MKRILLLLKHQENRRLLSQWLTEQYQVLSLEAENELETQGKQLLAQPFDLGLIDFGVIRKLRQQIIARRETEQPLFLPFVFLTTHQKIGISTDHLEPLIDDIVYMPIDKIEFQARLRVLLRSRSYSLELQGANEKLEKALSQEQELNKFKSRFVSMVSHEFRNPLNIISGTTQILEQYGDSLTKEKKQEILQQLKRNIAKMNDLLENVLIIGRKDMGKLKFQPAPLELETFCQGLIAQIQTAFKNKQQINFVYQGEQRQFNLDSNLLHHILSNLLSNACKYSPQDSIVELEVHCQPSEIVLSVRDRGIGISPEEIPKLFDSFYRASNVGKIKGTGLGLAIVKQYVELHQGAIAVESKVNAGTVFTVTLPSGN
jgi:signal transduction histidine kinase